MSRCFPYPPPGYVKNGVSGDTLIDSIKLQRETEKAEKDKKKRERKQKKREEKEKKKREKESRRTKHDAGSDCKEKKFIDDDNKCNQVDKGFVDSKQLAKSDLTEELGQPNSLENCCYSSDATQSGNKRKRVALPSTNNLISHGNIQIRYPLLKHKVHDSSNKEESHTESRNIGSSNQGISRENIVKANEISACEKVDASLNKKEPGTKRGETDSHLQEKSREIYAQEHGFSTSVRSNIVQSNEELHPRVNTIKRKETDYDSLQKEQPSAKYQRTSFHSRGNDNSEITQLPTQYQTSTIKENIRQKECPPQTDLVIKHKKDDGSFNKAQAHIKKAQSLVQKQDCPTNFIKAKEISPGVVVKPKDSLFLTRAQIVSKESNHGIAADKICSTSGKNESLPPRIKENINPKIDISKSVKKKMARKELLYKELFQNLVPYTAAGAAAKDDDDDLQWLLRRKENNSNQGGGEVFNSSSSSRNTSSLYDPPQACYVAEVDLYVLPYTIPY